MKSVIMIHASYKPIEKLHNVKQSDKPNFKPSGLWYAEGRSWIEFSETFRDEYHYFYLMKIKHTVLTKPNPNRVLKINNENDFDSFTFKYGIIQDEMLLINWNNVSTDFAGIEIIPYQQKTVDFLWNMNNDPVRKQKYIDNGLHEFHVSWYSIFDVPSGCVWNMKAIGEFRKLSKKQFQMLIKN